MTEQREGQQPEDDKSDLQELTLPTSMMIAFITWALRSNRIDWGPRNKAFGLLDRLLRSCAATGKLKLHLRPEYVRGSSD